MRRWPHLDGLRGIAALLVLVSHVGFWTGATAHGFVGGLMARGDVGVAVFFALSAFLLVGPWLESHPGDSPTQRAAIVRYAVRRVARILPAYLVVLVGVLLTAPLWGDGLGGSAKVLTHLLLLQGFTGTTYQSFSQTWSLTTEVTFYVLVPLVVPVAARALCSPRLRWTALGVIVGTGVLVQLAVATLHGSSDDRVLGPVGVSAIGHAAWFGAGLCVLAVRRRPPSPRWIRTLLDDASGLVLLAVVILVAATTDVAGPRDLTPTTVWAAGIKEVLYAAFAGVVLLAATAPTQRWWVGHPIMAALGRWSYGIFLWHVLVLQGLHAVLGLRLFGGDTVLVLLATLALTVLLSAATYRVVEAPILARAQGTPARRRVPTQPRSD